MKEAYKKILKTLYYNDKILFNAYKGNFNEFYNKCISQSGGGYKVNYKGEKIKFIKQMNDGQLELLLSSQDNKWNCSTILIDKNKKEARIQVIQVNKEKSCFDALANDGQTITEITIRMLKKYKDTLKINKISLKDNSLIYCKPIKIELGKLSFLQYANTFYGRFGFVPKNLSKKYDYKQSQEKIKNLVVKDINLNDFLQEYEIYYKKEFNKKKFKLSKKIQKIIKSYDNLDNKNKPLTQWFRSISKKYMLKECIFFERFINYILKEFKIETCSRHTFILDL